MTPPFPLPWSTSYWKHLLWWKNILALSEVIIFDGTLAWSIQTSSDLECPQPTLDLNIFTGLRWHALSTNTIYCRINFQKGQSRLPQEDGHADDQPTWPLAATELLIAWPLAGPFQSCFPFAKALVHPTRASLELRMNWQPTSQRLGFWFLLETFINRCNRCEKNWLWMDPWVHIMASSSSSQQFLCVPTNPQEDQK